LQRFVSIDVDAHTFANDLTLKTCEVEEIIQRKIPEKVLIGKATQVEKHPEADKLFVCQVDCGSA
jgi:phenylalanyl-tRNA synthetase beta chain